MTQVVSSNGSNSNTTAAETQTVFTPEQVVEQLRVLRASIPNVTPLTPKERRAVRHAKVPAEVLQAQIAVIGASETISDGVGTTADAAQEMVTDHTRWTNVEGELAALLNGVSGGNLSRREKLQLLGQRAYGMGLWLSRGEDHADLKPHVERVRRLKRLSRSTRPAPDVPPPDGSQHPAGT